MRDDPALLKTWGEAELVQEGGIGARAPRLRTSVFLKPWHFGLFDELALCDYQVQPAGAHQLEKTPRDIRKRWNRRAWLRSVKWQGVLLRRPYPGARGEHRSFR